MFDAVNEVAVWCPAPRNAFFESLESMCGLRDRVMHHEPIYFRDLSADRNLIYELLGYIEPVMVVELRRIDRLPEVLGRMPLFFVRR